MIGLIDRKARKPSRAAQPEWPAPAFPAALLGSVILFALACGEPPELGPDSFDAIGARRVGWANVTDTEAVLAVDLTAPSEVRLSLRASRAPDWSDALELRDAGSSLHHELSVTHLTPSASYSYRLSVGGDEWADGDRLGRPLSLRTARGADERSCLALLADSQGGAFRELLPELNDLTDRVGAVLSLGDLVAVGADAATTAEHQYLDYLLDPLSDVTSHVPLFAVLGNHDASHSNDPGAVASAMEAFHQYLVLPTGGLTPELDYSVEIGGGGAARAEQRRPGAREVAGGPFARSTRLDA